MYGRPFIRHGSFFGQADNAARPQILKIDRSMPIVAEIEQIRNRGNCLANSRAQISDGSAERFCVVRGEIDQHRPSPLEHHNPQGRSSETNPAPERCVWRGLYQSTSNGACTVYERERVDPAPCRKCGGEMQQIFPIGRSSKLR
jgi:hypothetical protein